MAAMRAENSNPITLLWPPDVPEDVAVTKCGPDLKSCCLKSIVGRMGRSAGVFMSSEEWMFRPVQIFL